MKARTDYLALGVALVCSGATHAGCQVRATPLAFGNYSVASSLPTRSTATISVRCDEVLPVDATIGVGASARSGGFYPRQMERVGRTDRLDYNLFIDAAGQTVWGDDIGASRTVILQRVTKSSMRKPLSLTLFGEIPALQNVSIGRYEDQVTVFVNW